MRSAHCQRQGGKGPDPLQEPAGDGKPAGPCGSRTDIPIPSTRSLAGSWSRVPSAAGQPQELFDRCPRPAWLICSSLVLPDSSSFPARSARCPAPPMLQQLRAALCLSCPHSPGAPRAPSGMGDGSSLQAEPSGSCQSPWRCQIEFLGLLLQQIPSEGSSARRFPACPGCGMALAAEGRGDLIPKSRDFPSPALLPRSRRLKGGIESSGAAADVERGRSRECFQQQNSDGRKWAGDTPQTKPLWEGSSADALPPHQHSRSSMRLLPSAPRSKGLRFHLGFLPRRMNRSGEREEREAAARGGPGRMNGNSGSHRFH